MQMGPYTRTSMLRPLTRLYVLPSGARSIGSASFSQPSPRSLFLSTMSLNSLSDPSFSRSRIFGVRNFSLSSLNPFGSKGDAATTAVSNSSDATGVAAESVTSAVSNSSDAASVATDAIASATDVASATASTLVHNPLQYGDMAAAGLAGWMPSGWFPYLLELTHISTGISWWATIILVTFGARLVVFPLVVRGQSVSGRLAPLQPQLAKIRAEVNEARARNDILAIQSAALRQRAMFDKAGVRVSDQILAAVGQLSVQLGFFIGLRRMLSLPVEEMKTGGFEFGGLSMMDLTASDPYFITPLLNFAVVQLQLKLSSRDLMAIGSEFAPHMLNLFRVLSFISIPFLAFFPLGLNIHLILSLAFISAQTMLLRVPRVRKLFKLAPLPEPKTEVATMRGSWEYIKKWASEKAEQARIEDVERRRKMALVKARGDARVGKR